VVNSKTDIHFWKSLLLKKQKWPVYQSISTQLWASQVDGTLPGDKVVSLCNPWPFCVPHTYPVSLNKGLKHVQFAQHWLWTYLKQNVRICLFWTMPLDWTQLLIDMCSPRPPSVLGPLIISGLFHLHGPLPRHLFLGWPMFLLPVGMYSYTNMATTLSFIVNKQSVHWCL
jgi:hypothetical protein